MSFETIKEFYELGLWNELQIKELLTAGAITEYQYDNIIGISGVTQNTQEVSNTTNIESTTVARG